MSAMACEPRFFLPLLLKCRLSILALDNTNTKSKKIMADNVTVDPRYLKYDKAEVEKILDDVVNTTLATEEGVRNIVKNYEPEVEPEPEEP